MRVKFRIGDVFPASDPVAQVAALESLGNRNEGEPVVNKLLSLFISLHRFRFMK